MCEVIQIVEAKGESEMETQQSYRRDRSRPVFFRCSQATHEAIKKYAFERETSMATAIIMLCREGIQLAERQKNEPQPPRGV